MCLFSASQCCFAIYCSSHMSVLVWKAIWEKAMPAFPHSGLIIWRDFDAVAMASYYSPGEGSSFFFLRCDSNGFGLILVH